ncbi:MAG: GTP cyclohydrolase II [Candidatus Altiarchaeota archaeon]
MRKKAKKADASCRGHVMSRPAARIVASSQDAALPTMFGSFSAKAFRDQDGREHLAVYKGDIASKDVPVRLHSQCTTGDIFHSLRCDCGQQLEMALNHIERKGKGAVIYLAQEGRGIGLLNKINAYVLQERGLDTVEANEMLGFASDGRGYAEAAEILRILGIRSVRLMTNNPQKINDLSCHGIEVAGRIPVRVKPNRVNRRYMQTKKTKMNHFL